MQFKRLKKLIETHQGVITNVSIIRDRYTLKDYFSAIEFKYKNKLYKIYYNKDKRAGYEYSFAEGTERNNLTIVSSLRSYKQIKETLMVIFS